VMPDGLRVAPGLAAVVAAAQEHVDFAGVAATVLAPFAKRQQDPLFGDDQRRDAIAMVAPLAAGEDGRLNEVAGPRLRRDHQHDDCGAYQDSVHGIAPAEGFKAVYSNWKCSPHRWIACQPYNLPVTPEAGRTP